MSDTPDLIQPGVVEVTLPGFAKPLKLVPSLTAAINLSRAYGGLQGLQRQVMSFDLACMVDVVAAGASLTDKGKKKLPEAVYSAGIVELMPLISRYVLMLGTGGRPLEKPETGDEADTVEEDVDPSLE